MNALPLFIKNDVKKYGPESLVFDITGFVFIFLFQRFIATGQTIASSFPPVVAAILVDISFIVIAATIMALGPRMREERAGFALLLVSGGYALMMIAQPIVVTSMMRRFSVLPDDPFTLVSFFAGLAVIFPAVLGYGDEKRSYLLKVLGISLVAGIAFYGKLPVAATTRSLPVLAVSAVIYLACFIAYTPKAMSFISEKVEPIKNGMRGYAAPRLAVSVLVTFFMWIWWELAIDSIGVVNPNMTIGQKLVILYFTGPLLYRLALIALPPFSWFNLAVGTALLAASLV